MCVKGLEGTLIWSKNYWKEKLVGRIMHIKKKYESGAATNYITRGRALKKLQLSLKDFRRLCILKGIYPHEPLHKKKVNKGSTENRVYYYVKDINFLASEPIIQKFREYKIFLRKLTTAKAKREDDRVKKLYETRPEYRLDHIVKERYPTFESALRDLDDALCLLFAFAVLPHTKIITTALVASSRRLTAEFNHYIIESKSLSKVFVSIKGIYYEAEVMGERITWIVGHDRGVGHVTEVDFSVMATFAEFYVTMLEFVNFRLYKSLGLFYPPKIAFISDKVENDDEMEAERVYCLAAPLSRRENHDEEQVDLNIDDGINNELSEKLLDLEKRKHLFSNCRFWLNREVPKDVLAIVIRNCGGMVSWDNCPVATFPNDSQITHQIIDRPLPENHKNISRIYVQPQWVFDSFNKRTLLPVTKYLPGAVLPPHLSPFSNDYHVQEEQLEQLKLFGKASSNSAEESKINKKQVKKESGEEKGEIPMEVKKSRMHKENLQKKLNEQGHELKLREMLIPKKRRRVYAKIKRGIKRRVGEEKKLNEKRRKLLETSE